MSRKEIRQQLEAWGEPKVRQMLADGHRLLGEVDSPYQNEIVLWLSDKTEDRSERRAKESISISRKALHMSTLAVVIAAVAIIIANKEIISTFVIWLLRL